MTSTYEMNENGTYSNQMTKVAVQDVKDAGKKAGKAAYQMKQEGVSNEEISKYVHTYYMRMPNGTYFDKKAIAIYIETARVEYKKG